MKTAWTALLVGLVPTTLFAAEWRTDYAAALAEAKKDDKPVLAYFTTGKTDLADDPALKDAGDLAHNFVLLHADKSNPQGERLFQLFKMPGDAGLAVVERDQAWQFARAERALKPSELRRVLGAAVGAKGKPTVDLVTQAVSAEETQVDKAKPVSSEATEVIESGSTYCPSCQRRRR